MIKLCGLICNLGISHQRLVHGVSAIVVIYFRYMTGMQTKLNSRTNQNRQGTQTPRQKKQKKTILYSKISAQKKKYMGITTGILAIFFRNLA